ncbi:MAG: hypothetical protein J7M30_09165, partial [Deltaproteobacteria bacterium]|nr:hypothetical protein [Deltaproteobacteria bacterium]
MAHNTAVDTHHKSGFWASKPGYKPVLLLIAAVVFTGIVVMPTPQGMVDLVSKEAPPGYKLGKGCKTITETVNNKLHPKAFNALKGEGKESKSLLSNEQAAQMAKIMVAILLMAAFLWGTEALPLGA